MQDCVKTEEQKHHHNVAITAVFDGIYSHLYVVAKAPPVGVKDARKHQRVTLWNLKKANPIIITLCHTR